MSIEDRSTARRRTSSAEPRTQPTRRPPHTDFDTEPIVITAESIAAAGVAGAVKPSSTKVSSTITVVPVCRAARSTSRRASSPTSAPVGLWWSGMRKASRGAVWRSAARIAATSQPPAAAIGTGTGRTPIRRAASMPPG